MIALCGPKLKIFAGILAAAIWSAVEKSVD